MKYIESIREGERISGIYLCKQRQSAVTKNGKSYENLILQDKTGVVDASSGIRIPRASTISRRWIISILWRRPPAFRARCS